MNITVTVDEITLSTVIAQTYGHDEDGDPVALDGERTVAHLVAEQIVAQLVRDARYPALRDEVLTVRREEIRAAVRPSIDEALARPIHRTNGYGERTGEVTTLSELIVTEARKYLAEPADTYHRERGTVLQKAIREEVAAAFKGEIAAAVKAAKEAVTREIGEQLAAQVAAAVRTGLTAR